jgi:hypothetical protein
MPNAIKYNTVAETLALKKGNFYIGTGDVGKGPTSSTGYYNGITPPSGGYTIYLNKESNGPSIYTVTTEAQMVSLTNTIGSQNFTTSGQCLNWFATQTDKMIFNIDYPAIVTNGLVLNLDAGFTPSYSRSGTTWYDVSSSNNGTLTNGPTFNSANGGSIVFDGIDDYVDILQGNLTSSTTLTIEFITTFTDGVYSMSGGMSFYGACYPYFYGGSAGNFEGYVGVYTRPSNITPYTGFGSFSVGFQSCSQYFANVNNIIMNTPYIMTGVYSPTQLLLYVNGSLASSRSTGTSPNFDSNGLRLGSGNKSFNGWFNGSIHDIKQYNRALSASEVLQNYNAQKSRFGL